MAAAAVRPSAELQRPELQMALESPYRTHWTVLGPAARQPRQLPAAYSSAGAVPVQAAEAPSRRGTIGAAAAAAAARNLSMKRRTRETAARFWTPGTRGSRRLSPQPDQEGVELALEEAAPGLV